jgi:hypothetical protein
MRNLGFAMLCLASLGVTGYALVTYTARPLGVGVHPQMKLVFETHQLGIYLHVFAASLALCIGPWQFLGAFRARYPGWHQVMGRIYVFIGVGVGGFSGLYMSWFAYGGWVSTIGFGLGALIWLYTAVRGILDARARRFDSHRDWMTRNFAMTLAAVSLRVGLGLGFASQLPFHMFYPALAWLSWVPNLLLAEWLLRSRKQATATKPA